MTGPTPRSPGRCRCGLLTGVLLAATSSRFTLHVSRSTCGLLLGVLLGTTVGAATGPAAFETANNLFLKGQYAAAVAAYQKLIAEEGPSAVLYFNLGNACYKADHLGQAIAAYRAAARLTPRDPALRANLQFVRKKVADAGRGSGPFWRDWLSFLTLNEWTSLGAAALWLWFLLLAVREMRPGWAKSLRGVTALAGTVLLLIWGCLGVAAYERFGVQSGVVLRQAVARFGPLDESKVSHQLPDGAEVMLLDQKQDWVQVRDARGRVGWIRKEQFQAL